MLRNDSFDAPEARPPAPWRGGKRFLSRTIVPILDRHPHVSYVEPFLGMGGIFLRRRTARRIEVVNDRSRDVATLFRIVQRHLPQFLDVLRFQLTSRAEFDRLREVDPTSLTDLERAARFLYLQRLAYGGKAVGQNFGTGCRTPARFNLTTVERDLQDLHERLAGVVVECLDWAEVIDRYDQEHALFYLDPPYWGGEEDYGKGVFAREDFARIAERLRALRGAFLLSLGDRPEVREVFEGFPMREVSAPYTLGTRAGQRTGHAPELLIASEGVLQS